MQRSIRKKCKISYSFVCYQDIKLIIENCLIHFEHLRIPKIGNIDSKKKKEFQLN